MHELNVLILGPSSFISTLNEVKSFLKFNPIIDNNIEYNIILYHKDILQDESQKNFIVNSNSIKICITEKKEIPGNCDAHLELPTTLNEINTIIENVVAKKKFYKNSSITIKDYSINKNEKKLFKSNEFIILTEKEIQLLELFLNNKNPISKDKILSSVWNYSSDADTHTVETHIYRLRKKISDKFLDDKFILNNKNGYFL